MTGSDIAFGMDGQILATTLPRPIAPALGACCADDAAAPNVRLRGEEFVALPLPLAAHRRGLPRQAAAGGARSSGRAPSSCGSCSEIHTELAVTAVVAVLLATLLSFAVARTITRPLAAITDVMREVAATGDLTRKIVLRPAAGGTTRTHGCWPRPSTR